VFRWDRVFREQLRTGKRSGFRIGKCSRKLKLWALQTGFLHPRSHWGQRAAFPGMLMRTFAGHTPNIIHKSWNRLQTTKPRYLGGANGQ